MAPAAETVLDPIDRFNDVVTQEDWRPLVLVVPEMAADEAVRQRAAHFIGAVALEGLVTVNEDEVAAPEYTLMDAMREAAYGDVTARRLIETNVRTDVVERTIKSGHVMAVNLDVDDCGRIRQHGQTAESIQENSLRYAADSRQMRARTEAETHNMFRIDEAYRSGLLEDYAFVVFSRAADDMAPEAMQEVGFFTDTMSCAIQVTTAVGEVVTTESAFVAGKMQAATDRHDKETIARVGELLGADLSGSATETLATPLLVHKSLLPNGAIDLVQMYDDCAGGTFFGEDAPQEDYLVYRRQCREREAEFEPKVQLITDELIAQAAYITDPVQATETLNNLSARHMIDQAIADDSIDARVFGTEAAFRIEQARHYVERGELERAAETARLAVRVEKSSSCPGGGRSGTTTANGAENGESTKNTSTGKVEDCDFVSKKCPVCGEKNAKTRVRNGVYYHVGKSCKG